MLPIASASCHQRETGPRMPNSSESMLEISAIKLHCKDRAQQEYNVGGELYCVLMCALGCFLISLCIA